MNINQIIGRERRLFAADIEANQAQINDAVRGSRILLFGGAGSIGKEVASLLYSYNPAALHVVDISENNLVELVRTIRSGIGYMDCETRFFPLEMDGCEIDAFLATQAPYDYVLNLAAMKHVRSEKDAYSLMRLVRTNVLDTLATLKRAKVWKARKYFAVSTDKAKNPANLMGASKRIMEDVLFAQPGQTAVSTARFANVAFSDGSLLHGFRQRLALQQPISAPRDVRRYFVTGAESGDLCLASLVLGADREIFFPKLEADLELRTFSEIAVRFLEANGYEPFEVSSEDEARERTAELISTRRWPCYFFASDTSGEKPFEEFYSDTDQVDWSRLADVGIIRAPALDDAQTSRAHRFIETIMAMRKQGRWERAELVNAIVEACPELAHVETGKYLDDRM